MKQLSQALQEKLALQSTTLAVLWTLQRKDGVILRMTDHDDFLVIDGQTYQPGATVTLEQSSVRHLDQSDDVIVSGALSADALTEDDLQGGLWDGAEVQCSLADWSARERVAVLFSGQVGAIERDANVFRVEITTLRALLQRPVGRIYARRCDAQLGDARCKINLSDPSWRRLGVVALKRDEDWLGISGFAETAPGWLTEGRLLTGAHTVRIVQHEKEGELDWLRTEQSAQSIAVGLSVTALPGCDKRMQTCVDRFSNVVNFRGFPHLLGVDALLASDDARSPRDGGSRWRR